MYALKWIRTGSAAWGWRSGRHRDAAGVTVFGRPAGGSGEPVEVDGMTFVVQQLAAVRSMPGSNGQPLIAETGNRLWLLTVSVPQRQPGGGSRPLLPWRARKDQAGSGSRG
jgi:hypothetical protein